MRFRMTTLSSIVPSLIMGFSGFFDKAVVKAVARVDARQGLVARLALDDIGEARVEDEGLRIICQELLDLLLIFLREYGTSCIQKAPPRPQGLP